MFDVESPSPVSAPISAHLNGALRSEALSSHGLGLSEVRRRQLAFFASGATRSYAFRVAQLERLRAAIESHEEAIYQALYQDLHKSREESFLTEIGFLYEEIRYTLQKLRTWMKPEAIKTPLLLLPARSRVIREPLGQVLIISPWNYPFQLLFAPVIGAIAAGNTLVLKPSELSPQTSKVIGDLVRETFDPDFISVFEGGVDVSQSLLAEAWHHIFFTGSTAVGRIVAQAAAKHLTPVTLELGGKSPAIVDDSANIEVAARRIAFGKFINAGQTCIAPDYVIVHESRKDALVKALAAELHSFFADNPQQSASYGRIVNERHFDRLERLLHAGTIVIGGRRDRSDRYIEPTVLVDVKPIDPIMQEEIFGPLLPVLTYRSYEDVLGLVRSMPHPLALYLFSERRAMQDAITRDLAFGGGAINDTVMHFLNSHMPFGGVGASGQGSAHGEQSFLTFSHRKSILQNPSWIDLPARYAPYTQAKAKLFQILLKRELNTVGTISLFGLSLFMMLAGFAHFANPEFYLRMMPPALPAPHLLVALSGIAEILLGLALLWKRLRYWAALGIMALLVAVFPANIYMAMNPELFPEIPAIAYWLRLPLQLLFLAWAASFRRKQ